MKSHIGFIRLSRQCPLTAGNLSKRGRRQPHRPSSIWSPRPACKWTDSRPNRIPAHCQWAFTLTLSIYTCQGLHVNIHVIMYRWRTVTILYGNSSSYRYIVWLSGCFWHLVLELIFCWLCNRQSSYYDDCLLHNQPNVRNSLIDKTKICCGEHWFWTDTVWWISPARCHVRNSFQTILLICATFKYNR